MRLTSFPLLIATLTPAATAQIIGIDDLNPATGTSNAFPFSVTGGQTSLHVYSAQTLRSLGVCGGAVLLDVEVAPSSGTSGTYNVPQAKLEIGHLAVSPPIAGNWGAHLASPIVVHDLTSGPYTFAWTLNTYVSLPGMSTCGFVWDGVNDIGIQYTSSSGLTGGFNARRTATQLRHYVAIFGATTQLPTSNGLFAMEVRMTWAGSANCASRQTYGAGCGGLSLAASADPIVNQTINLVTSGITATAPFGGIGMGFVQFNPGLSLAGIGMPGCLQHNELLAVLLFFPLGASSVAVPFAVPAYPGVAVQTQSVVYDPTAALTPLGAVTSAGVQLTIGN
jgi:hypothetical protein